MQARGNILKRETEGDAGRETERERERETESETERETERETEKERDVENFQIHLKLCVCGGGFPAAPMSDSIHSTLVLPSQQGWCVDSLPRQSLHSPSQASGSFAHTVKAPGPPQS